MERDDTVNARHDFCLVHRTEKGKSATGEDIAMKVKNLMHTSLATLQISDTLDIAEDVMRMGRIRHLPVVNADKRIVGLVTQRDLFKASISSVLGLSRENEHEWIGTIKVKDVMTQEVITVSPETEIVEAVDKLLTAKFSSLPVVDETGVLIGLLTETDCLGCFHDLLKMGTFQDVLS